MSFVAEMFTDRGFVSRVKLIAQSKDEAESLLEKEIKKRSKIIGSYLSSGGYEGANG